MSQEEKTTVYCRAPGCHTTIEIAALPLQQALDRAKEAGWSVNPHARGVWP